jgi:hypothetical protein
VSERLEAAVLAEQRVQRELEARLAAGGLRGEERAAYEAQLERLRELIRRLRAGAGPAPVVGTSPGGGPAQALTPDERTAILDRQLDAAIGDFDELLLREQRVLENRARAVTDSGGAGGGAGTAGTSGASGASGAPGASGASGASGTGGAVAPASGRWTDPAREAKASSAATPDAAAGGQGDAGGAPGRGERKPGSYVAATRADASDDDVVARQLREAAESETDPELRERLWEEYRRYKEGRR